MDEAVERTIQSHRWAAAFFLGTAITLLLTTPAGGLSPHTLAPGWFGLWLASTLGSGPLGVMLLAGPAWRPLPIESRRAPALAYLTACTLDMLAVALLLVSTFHMGPAIWLPVGCGVLLTYLFVRLYPDSSAKAEDLFP